MMANNTTDLSPNSSECLVLKPRDFIPWNNPDNIISFETEQLLRKLRDLVFLPITFLIGMPANVINMAVFYKQGLKERINVCLFALSLADGMYLVLSMVAHGEQLYLHFTTKEIHGPILQWMVNNYLMGLDGFSWVSPVLSAIVASERCFCVMQPLKSQTILRTSTMTAIIVAVFIVVIGLRFVVATRYYIVCAYDPVSDSIIMTTIGGEFYIKHKQLVDFLEIVVYGLGLPWVVIVVIITTTVATVIKLHQAVKWRANISSSSDSISSREFALTRMLVANSFFFMICVFPVGLFRLLLLFMPEMSSGRRQRNIFAAGVWLVDIFILINGTFNIIVYYTMGSRYRHTLWTLLGRKSTMVTSSKTSVSTTSTMQ